MTRAHAEPCGSIRAKAGLVAILSMGAAMLTLAPAADAACTDAPAPGVVWQRCLFDTIKLPNHDLEGANLREAYFARADLSGSDLSEVDARRARFINATLRGVTFDRASLREADFTKAVLADASLRDADLRGAQFFRANLRKADLTGARIERTTFFEADLSGAIWTDGKTVCAEGSFGRCT
ncbi:MAG: pentapeptide repeat-containing protein [Alphaproteobacteria bacterium]|nr:pentapeptide repeat-containing protein [Alphaproteobacteria bacterium]